MEGLATTSVKYFQWPHHRFDEFLSAFSTRRLTVSFLTIGLMLVSTLSIASPILKGETARPYANSSDAAEQPSIVPFQPDVMWGGRTVAVDVSPADTNVAVAASESGGLFKTTDSGITWSHLDSLPPFRMSDVKFAPSNGQILIASAWSDSNVTSTGGIWRSLDGGASWTKPPTSNPPASQLPCASSFWRGPDSAAGVVFPRPSTWGIAFAPDSNDVYVGTDCGVAVSHD